MGHRALSAPGADTRRAAEPQPHTAWVAYVGPFLFPWGEASSLRVGGIVRSLAAAGYRVVVAGGGSGPPEPTRLELADGSGSVSYVGLGDSRLVGSGLVRHAKVFMTWGLPAIRWLEAQRALPSHVIVHGGFAQYMYHILRWCRARGVPVIVDVFDWNNGHHMRGGFFGPLHISMKLALRHYYHRCDGVIAISSLLDEYYQARGSTVLRIPPTLDVQNLEWQPVRPTRRSSELVLVYAGNPGRNKKDLLTTIIDAVDQVDSDGSRVALRIYGPTSSEVRSLRGGAPLPPSVHALGRLPQEEMPRVLQDADFTVLVRRPERSTNAGFSTKFCESLANGTPIIANLTGDMRTYLRHGREGLVCPDHSVESLAGMLRTALGLSIDARNAMRQAARRRAQDCFDFRAYAEPIRNFLEAVRGPRPGAHSGAMTLMEGS